MILIRRRAMLAAGLMAASFAGATAWRPTAKLADQRPRLDLETLFPKRFGGWMVDDRMPVQLVSPDAQAVIDKIYSQTLSRTYIGPGGVRIMLSVAYGGDQSDATRAHRPEVCYPAQGFQILRSGSSAYPVGQGSLRVRQLVAKQGGRVEPISYWIVVGERLTLSGTEQKLAQLRYTMSGTIPDGMLVRVSNIDPEAERSYAVHARFLADLASELQGDARLRVLGT